jgi:tetratricopeptide (TPR) repeat protein
VNVYLIVSRSPARRTHEFLMSGHRAYERGNYAAARIQFERYVEQEPDAAEALFMLGLTCFRLGEGARGEEVLLRAVEIRPGFALAHVALSERYRQTGRIREALRSAEAAVSREPVPPEAWKALGTVLIELRDHEGAIRALGNYSAARPEDVETHLQLGDLYFSREMRGLEDVNRGLAKRRFAQAVKHARNLLDRNEGDVRARIWLAKGYAGLSSFEGGSQIEWAIREVNEAIEAASDDPEHRLLLARLLDAKGDHEGAAGALERARLEAPSPEVYISLARARAARLGEPAIARRILEEGCERYPDETGMRIALVAHLRREEETDDARRVMEAALEDFPGSAGVLEAAADLDLALGHAEAAVASLQRALEVRPQSLTARRKLVAILLPAALRALEEGDGDASVLQEVREHTAFFLDEETGLNPADLQAREWRARMAYAAGDFTAAAEILAQLGEESRRTYSGLRILGISLLQSAAYPDASQALFAALDHPDSPRTPDDHEIAYTAAFRAGQAARQVEICRMVLDRWPQNLTFRLRLAESLFRSGRPKEALAACAGLKTRLAGTRNVQAHLLAARIHQALGEVEDARRELEDAVAIRRDTETRGALYAFFAAIGRTDLAEAGFEALAGERPDDPAVALRYGDHLLRQSRKAAIDVERRERLRRRALEQYRRVLALDPASRDAMVRLTELSIAEASREQALESAAEAVSWLEEKRPGDPYQLYFEGKRQLLLGDFEAARESLARFVRAIPGDPAGYYYLGIAFRRTGDLVRAKAQFLAVLQMDPSMVEAKLQLATLYFTDGLRAHWNRDWDAARAAFERVADIDPREPETRRFLAEIFTLLGMPERALEEADRVLAEKPEDRGALFLSGLLLARRGEFEGAVERFRRLVELEPENPHGHLYLGVLLAEMGEFDGGRSEITRAYQLNQDSDEVLRAIVLCEVAAGREEELVHFVERERSRTPRRAAVHSHLGWLYRRLGRTEEAVDAYRSAFRLAPENAAALAMAAAILADEGRLDEAITLLDEGAGASTAPGRLLFLKGRLLIEKGKEEEGETALRRSLIAEPELLEGYRELGLLLLRRGEAVEGEEHLRTAVERGLSDPTVFFHLARRATARRDLESAVRNYRLALEHAPEDFATLNNLASLLAASETTREEAIALARKALSLRPDDPRVLDTLGWTLYLDEKYDEAAGLLVAAAQALPSEVSVLHHAGVVCHRLYRWGDAERFLTRALELAPEHPEAAEARQILEQIR